MKYNKILLLVTIVTIVLGVFVWNSCDNPQNSERIGSEESVSVNQIVQVQSLHDLRSLTASEVKETNVYIVSRLHAKLPSQPKVFSFKRGDSRTRILNTIETLYRNPDLGRFVEQGVDNYLPDFGATNSNKTLAELGITEFHAQKLWGEVNPKLTWTADDAAYQYALYTAANTDLTTIEGGGAKYHITQDGKYPTNKELKMFNVDLTTTKKIAFLKSIPLNQVEALNNVNRKFVFYGCSFFGGRIGLDLGNSYGSVIENCSFTANDTCFQMAFCLMPTVRNNFFTNYNKVGRIFTYGKNWQGGSTSNSQSNHVLDEHSRDFSKIGCYASVIYEAVSGGRYIAGILEGSKGGDYGLIFDTKNATVIKDFYLSGTHVETGYNIAAIYQKAGHGGIFEYEKIYCQYANVFKAETYGGEPEIRIKDWPYNAGWTFSNTGLNNWHFQYNKGFGNIVSKFDNPPHSSRIRVDAPLYP